MFSSFGKCNLEMRDFVNGTTCLWQTILACCLAEIKEKTRKSDKRLGGDIDILTERERESGSVLRNNSSIILQHYSWALTENGHHIWATGWHVRLKGPKKTHLFCLKTLLIKIECKGLDSRLFYLNLAEKPIICCLKADSTVTTSTKKVNTMFNDPFFFCG